MAVYTKVSEDEAKAFLSAYDIGAFVNLTGIKAGVENSNYILLTMRGRFILTLYEKRVRVADLPFFLGLMEHLARKNVPCPLPMRSKDGELFRTIVGHSAAIVTFLEGGALARLDVEDCAEVGRAMAVMHLAAKDFSIRRPNALSLPGWEKLAADCGSRADEAKPGLAAMIKMELDYLRSCWPVDLPRGIIHADLFSDNIFFRQGKLCGLIDFYFACEDALAYDLAICLNSLCFERDSNFNITKARALLRGYAEKRPLSRPEKEMLPTLARGAALRFLLTRLYDQLHQVPGALVKVKNPLEYLMRLEFHQKIGDVSGYGIDT